LDLRQYETGKRGKMATLARISEIIDVERRRGSESTLKGQRQNFEGTQTENARGYDFSDRQSN
jgi:hypothetical protein